MVCIVLTIGKVEDLGLHNSPVKCYGSVSQPRTHLPRVPPVTSIKYGQILHYNKQVALCLLYYQFLGALLTVLYTALIWESE